MTSAEIFSRAVGLLATATGLLWAGTITTLGGLDPVSLVVLVSSGAGGIALVWRAILITNRAAEDSARVDAATIDRLEASVGSNQQTIASLHAALTAERERCDSEREHCQAQIAELRAELARLLD